MLSRRHLATLSFLLASAFAVAALAPAHAQPAPEPAHAQPAPAQADAGTASADGPAPVIELWTMGPGDLIWEKYGHTALCTRYPDPRDDRCYNYGTTNFAEPVKLVWDFLRNRTKFWVSTTTPTRIMRFYSQVLDRSIWVQPLPLSPEGARHAAQVLETSTLPENKFYRYHHYDDNCATRVRDIVDEVTDGGLQAAREDSYPYSLREITRRGMTEHGILSLLVDFPLGRRSDRVPDGWDAMHQPDMLRVAVEKHLGIEPVQIYERQGAPFDVSHPIARWWLMLMGLGFALPALLTWYLGRFQRLGLGLSIAPAGLVGLLLWVMATISTLPEIRWNEAILVMWPLDLLLPVLPLRLRQRYARFRLLWSLGLLLLSLIGVLHQPLWAILMWPAATCAIAALPARKRET
ncbi:DUF4105 domain-containing protein [Haliangium ochraceum]|uniref:Lnb N-terminal periplasmic domain-containing protein n=1 Tax=Haliangium ochraceum (strain DSM 14365 / JCM 11303 / SMP-2) TaxID=502025 RepID=D0LWH4_HALO1|nr:DUF4105 domain-containing protein [Haliangium ochraceum]ACY17624.1 conserved hypothetical protein [Haliangium ochraceum DSM 14365]